VDRVAAHPLRHRISLLKVAVLCVHPVEPSAVGAKSGGELGAFVLFSYHLHILERLVLVELWLGVAKQVETLDRFLRHRDALIAQMLVHLVFFLLLDRFPSRRRDEVHQTLPDV